MTENSQKHDSREKPDFDVLLKIRTLREERKWTEYELAQKAGITQSTICGWYKRNCTPTVTMIEKMCGAFGISLSQFFSTDGKTENENTDLFSEYLALWNRMDDNQRQSTVKQLSAFIENKG